MATGRPPGRPNKSVEQKKAEGNRGKRKLEPEHATQNTGIEIPVPANLGNHGRKLWVNILASTDYLDRKVDVYLLTLLCEAYNEYQVMRLELSKGTVPRFYTAPNGYIISHPYVKEVQELRKQMTAWLAAFGFSPADRARLVGAQATDDGGTELLDTFRDRRKKRLASDD
jgi:P27 family predicted phage terminase small subunit